MRDISTIIKENAIKGGLAYVALGVTSALFGEPTLIDVWKSSGPITAGLSVGILSEPATYVAQLIQDYKTAPVGKYGGR